MNEETPQQTIDSTADYLAALDGICRLANNNLFIFEKNFLDIGFNSSERFEILRNFLLRSPNHQLKLLAHDTRPLSQHCPRLLLLLRQFTHNMFIYQTPKHLQHITEAFALADDAHYVRRFHFDHTKGTFVQNDTEYAYLLKSRFMEMWIASQPSAHTSGLNL